MCAWYKEQRSEAVSQRCLRTPGEAAGCCGRTELGRSVPPSRGHGHREPCPEPGRRAAAADGEERWQETCREGSGEGQGLHRTRQRGYFWCCVHSVLVPVFKTHCLRGLFGLLPPPPSPLSMSQGRDRPGRAVSGKGCLEEGFEGEGYLGARVRRCKALTGRKLSKAAWKR